MGKEHLISTLAEMQLSFGIGSEHADFLDEVIKHIEKPDRLKILKDRITERLYTEASNLLYDPTDFFDDLSEDEVKTIKEEIAILITVSDSTID